MVHLESPYNEFRPRLISHRFHEEVARILVTKARARKRAPLLGRRASHDVTLRRDHPSRYLEADEA